jgi:site-specific recombinase XerD
MHVARHSMAYILSEANKPLSVIQSLLGHSDLTTTKIYIEALRSTDEMDEAMEGVF